MRFLQTRLVRALLLLTALVVGSLAISTLNGCLDDSIQPCEDGSCENGGECDSTIEY